MVDKSNISDIIQPINRDTIHKICSGQVVLNLANAVKELVENSIDAEATIIHIHLVNYGADLIEVSDNGIGVLKENFQNLTLKHYTSKIRQFSDLEHINTLGFRGEALSSLCALSELSILTKHRTAEHATKLQFDSNGKIVSEILGAREQGTTVTLQNLFTNLPVRRKEFMKNLKREFNKMCQLLYAYCLVSKGVKFSCTNVTGNNSKNKIVATDGFNTVKENIINVYGSKQISSLVDVELIQPKVDILEEYNIKLNGTELLPYTFEFLISSVTHGSGRSTNDRQFYYVNSRPCVPQKIIKLVNDIYKQYNSNQYPFVFLNIISKSCLVDVNVTPDKRQIFFERENLLLAIIKASLLETLKSFPSTFEIQNTNLSQSMLSFLNADKKGGESKVTCLKRNATESSITKGSILERFQKRSKSENNKATTSQINSVVLTTETGIKSSSDQNLDTFIKLACELQSQKETEVIVDLINSDLESKEDSGNQQILLGNNATVRTESGNKTTAKEEKDNEKQQILEKNNGTVLHEIKTSSDENSAQNKLDRTDSEGSITLVTIEEELEVKMKTITESIDSNIKGTEQKSVTVDVSIEKVKNALVDKNKKSKHKDVTVRFRSQIAPDANQAAEAELEKHFLKADFQNMTVIGQFNLGFIIAQLDNDLFIIDQHASDEKYNFEQLQSNCILEKQVCVNPKPLELTAGNENILIENVDIFNKNGFSFNIDDSAPCTKKVSLTSIPVSKNFVCGKDDIDEMLLMLQDSRQMCRPSRIRSMLASRACRKSVMVGKPLSKNDMKRLLEHMGEIEHPWNCPHGRPTMRHLINLDLIVKS